MLLSASASWGSRIARRFMIKRTSECQGKRFGAAIAAFQEKRVKAIYSRDYVSEQSGLATKGT